MRLGEAKCDKVPSERLVSVVAVGSIPVPFRVPVNNSASSGHAGVLSVDNGKIGSRVLDFSIAHVRQQGNDGQILTHH